LPQYTTVDEVRERLRLAPDDRDIAYLTLCVDAANLLVDNWLQRDPAAVDEVPYLNEKGHVEMRAATDTYPPLTEPFPEPVRRAAIGVAIRVYRFKDAESDISDVWSDGAPLRIPRDPLAGYVDLLAPYRPGRAWAPA